MTTYKMHKLKPTTLTTYEKWRNAHILPVFGELSIASITTDDIQRFLNDRKEMSSKSLTVMRNLMGEIFKDAVEDGLMEKDPTSSRGLIIPSDKVTEREALPLSDFKNILSHLPDLPQEERRMLSLLMLTGMRRGEVLGLRWEDIDVESGLIHVQRNVTHPQTNQPHIGTPKTKSGTRDIPLDPMLLELLMPIESAGFIIGGDQPITLRHYTNTWNRIKKAVDLHGATAHIFRHSYLNYAAGESSDIKSLQKIAGHSDIRMTMNRYVHAQPEKVKAVRCMICLQDDFCARPVHTPNTTQTHMSQQKIHLPKQRFEHILCTKPLKSAKQQKEKPSNRCGSRVFIWWSIGDSNS